MDSKFRTSFIPKKPIAQARRPSESGVGLFFLLTLVLFLGTALVTGGAYLYKEFLDRSIESKKEQLEAARAEFEPSTIQKLSELDIRIKSAGEILESHPSPSFFFDTLGDLTLKSVQFTDLQYSHNVGGDISVGMSGLAQSFSSVALQSDIFSDSDFFIDPIFADLNLDDSGNVLFNFTAGVDASLIRFEDVFDSAGYNTNTTGDSDGQNGTDDNGNSE